MPESDFIDLLEIFLGDIHISLHLFEGGSQVVI
jgi:hypothetical protein